MDGSTVGPFDEERLDVLASHVGHSPWPPARGSETNVLNCSTAFE
ncbi:MAG TPA: hypothetical protein VF494_10795 [Candidatus Limnocylindrales bacterium]